MEHIKDLAPRCMFIFFSSDNVVLLEKSMEELNGRLET